MALINITRGSEVEGIQIDDDFFDEMFPPEESGTTQPFERGAANMADALHVILGATWALKSGKNLSSAWDEVNLRSRRIH